MESLSKNATKSKYFIGIFLGAAHSKNNLWIIAADALGADAHRTVARTAARNQGCGTPASKEAF